MSGITAPMVLDGPIMGEWFAAYAQHVLAQTLQPGDIVILDKPKIYYPLSTPMLEGDPRSADRNHPA